MGKFGYRVAESNLTALDEVKLVDYLNEIDFSGNPGIDTIPEKIEVCKELQKLEGANCSLTKIPAQVCVSVRELKYIDLCNNKIVELPPELAKLSALTELYLSANALSGSISDEVLAGLTSLEFLYLDDNRLTSIGSLAACSALWELKLSGNALTELPTLGSHGDLELFKIGGNQIASVPAGYFEATPLVKEIEMNNNKLTSLPDGAYPESITSFDITGNDVDDVPAAIADKVKK